MTELRVQLVGQEAQLGLVPARDVARLIIAVEDALRRSAAVIRGEPKVRTGRYTDVIEQAALLRLRAVERGSVVPVLELPAAAATDDGFALDDATLGEAALARLLDAADPDAPPDPYVADALLGVTDEMRLGDRYESITFAVSGRDVPVARQVTVTGATRARLRLYVQDRPTAPERPDAITGTIVEADFERFTARLRTHDSPAVAVSFEEGQADAIQRALREPATLRGVVTFDPTTNAATRVDLQTVVRGEQLMFGFDPGAYWRTPTLAELAVEQGATGPVDLDLLFDYAASDEERDVMLAPVLADQ